MRTTLTMIVFSLLGAVVTPLAAVQHSHTDHADSEQATALSHDMLAAEYQWLLPETEAAQALLAEGIIVEEPFLQAVHALRLADEQGTLDTTEKTFEQQMADVIAERLQQLRQRIRRPPRNLYGHGAYTILESYEARMTALCLVMAQNPVALDDESYLRLEKLLMILTNRTSTNPRASGPFIEAQRFAAFAAAAQHGLRTASSPGGIRSAFALRCDLSGATLPCSWRVELPP